jgi:hypothetical protein
VIEVSMKREKVFQIKSKSDARYLAREIRGNDYAFYYYAPLMGVSGGMTTIRCPADTKKCTIISTGFGWQNEERNVIADIVEYIWKDRKQINAELRHPESEWYMKFIPEKKSRHSTGGRPS